MSLEEGKWISQSRAHALIVGEALVDIVVSAESSRVHPGGSAANTAVALSRLGRRTLLASSFGTDLNGRLIRRHLARAGVHVVNRPRGADRTSVARATIASDGSAEYTFDVDWVLRLPRRMHTPTVVHVSSLGPVLLPGAGAVQRLLDQIKGIATVVYDVNARPAITGLSRPVMDLVEGTVAKSDIVKASDEDLRTLYPRLNPESAARRLLMLGPRVVVVTRGIAGAVWFARSRSVEVPSHTTNVVDTIGAGDTFSAALIDGLWSRNRLEKHWMLSLPTMSEADVSEVLTYASTAASIAVSRAGANPPSRKELDAAIRL
ncbi:MAG: kdgK [Marmoricola sp.]|nr:kdgK [Marmoricola sp.]